MNLLGWLAKYRIESIIVLTKADKLPRHKSKERARRIGQELKKVSFHEPILFSAKSGEGRDEIWERIEKVLSD
jgi:GTP-binding protein